ncbi:MarR family winged helix-turn-helix transcriptional regulator [Sphingosinicella microcystinivorans]|uniref:MarR family transcriptional regulator n=1 Tax=Sphingosinicella microcystinivorans TaxID=335406 RepID=A0AAD1D8N7_SPHMI|nr:MarR family transcriptional regulator [Sphingosinicella microcystinivorans]RKS86311.1 MarR family transcriptional regulator [Sphingosinicella microcystinivorans]BBE35644.1 MarR family transcriptional regulator [Sphingosinicella microcystinivorans]
MAEPLDSDAQPILNRVSFMMHRINAHMLRICNPYFQDWGVDLVTSRMLVALLERGPMSAGEIVRIMALPQSTISHQIKRLEKLGYLTRTAGSQDSRIVIAELTDHGRDIANQANALSRRVTDTLLQAIGDDEVETVRAALKRVDQALEAMR